MTGDDVARFVKARRKTGASDVTVNAYLRILRAMINWAVNEELIERSPVRIRLLRTLDRKQVDVFTPEQIEEVLEHAEPKIRILVMIIAASGMRREEALHLQWVDVDFTRGRIDIRGKRYMHRKRDRSMVELVWTPKNYEERSVYVTPDVVRALQQFCSDQRWNDPEDWVFQSDKRRRQRWTSPTKPLHQAFKDAGIYEPGKLLHAVRHTVGTRLLRATDLETARAQLGHRNIATTMKYLHTDEERRRKAGQSIGLLGNRSGSRSSSR
jgi:integrase